MRFRTFLTYLSLLPLSACTKSCSPDYDNNEEFSKAQLPPYTDTGANTLGCVLGAQTWTVLGKYRSNSPAGASWIPNELRAYSNPALPSFLYARGQMTGVLNSRVFYDMEIALAFRLNDTLGGLRLLGTDTARVPVGRAETMEATNLVEYAQYKSRQRRPVRLFIRKLNRQQRIVSGTFSGTLYQARGVDSLTVKDGRFDFKY